MERRFRITCLDYSVSFGDVIYIHIGCRGPQFSLAMRSECCFCIVIQSFESRRGGEDCISYVCSGAEPFGAVRGCSAGAVLPHPPLTLLALDPGH